MSWPSERLEELARRKELLATRAAAQRAAISGTFHEWRKPLAVADRVSRVVSLLRAHPLLFAAAVAALVAFPRGTLVSLVGRGIAAWRLWQTVAGFLAERHDGKRTEPG
jgi:YqjK-like protein